MTGLKCGLEPMEFNVIVFPDVVDEKTKGGLILPETEREKLQWAEQRGTVIAVAPEAFTDYGVHAAPGDRVIFSRHSGMTVKGADGRDYRIVKDKDIVAKESRDE
jgi:chaperonin GroES